MRNQPIRRVMTAPAWVIDAAARLPEARDLMARERLHHLPVVAGGRLAGILSAADLLSPGAAWMPEETLRVEDVMRRDPVSLDVNLSLHDAALRLASGAYHSLPVTDAEGAVVGIVTSSDLIVILLRQLPDSAPIEGGPGEIEVLEAVRQAADLYLRSGQGEHEHAALVRALERARERLGPGLGLGRI